jgi:hypothetical protein
LIALIVLILYFVESAISEESCGVKTKKNYSAKSTMATNVKIATNNHRFRVLVFLQLGATVVV